MPKNKDRKSLSSLFERSATNCDMPSETPTSGPLSKKNCQDEDPKVSNADILHAVNSLTDRFTLMEQQIAQNAIMIVNLSKTVEFVGEELKSLSTKVKTNDFKVSQIEKLSEFKGNAIKLTLTLGSGI